MGVKAADRQERNSYECTKGIGDDVAKPIAMTFERQRTNIECE